MFGVYRLLDVSFQFLMVGWERRHGIYSPAAGSVSIPHGRLGTQGGAGAGDRRSVSFLIGRLGTGEERGGAARFQFLIGRLGTARIAPPLGGSRFNSS